MTESNNDTIIHSLKSIRNFSDIHLSMALQEVDDFLFKIDKHTEHNFYAFRDLCMVCQF